MSDIVNVTIASQASQVVKISSVGVQGAGADILAYLQSLPSTLPSTPNMPWWDDNVLKRSAVSLFVIQSGVWVDTGTWIDSETWSDS